MPQCRQAGDTDFGRSAKRVGWLGATTLSGVLMFLLSVEAGRLCMRATVQKGAVAAPLAQFVPISLVPWVQCRKEGFLEEIKAQEGEGCRLSGFLMVSPSLVPSQGTGLPLWLRKPGPSVLSHLAEALLKGMERSGLEQAQVADNRGRCEVVLLSLPQDPGPRTQDPGPRTQDPEWKT